MVVRTKSNSRLTSALLVGIPFMIIGCPLLLVAVGMMLHQLRTRDWVEVPATIRQVQLLHEPGPQNSVLSRVACTYTYTFAGRGYEGNRVELAANECSPFNSSTSENGWYEAMCDRLNSARLLNQTAPCFVNPDNPAEALLDRDVRFGTLIVTLIFASVAGGTGLGVFVSNMHRFLRERRGALSDDPLAQWKAQRLTKDMCLGTLGVYWSILWLPLLLFIPHEIERGNYLALLTLVGPLVCLALIARTVYRIVRRRTSSGRTSYANH